MKVTDWGWSKRMARPGWPRLREGRLGDPLWCMSDDGDDGAAGARRPWAFRLCPTTMPETDTLTPFISMPSPLASGRSVPTVYRSIKTNAVVGCHIKQVKKTLLKRLQALRLGVEASELTLSLLLYVMPHAGAAQQGARRPVASSRYAEVARPLARVASKVRIPALIGRA
jgi:hypothetical protein